MTAWALGTRDKAQVLTSFLYELRRFESESQALGKQLAETIEKLRELENKTLGKKVLEITQTELERIGVPEDGRISEADAEKLAQRLSRLNVRFETGERSFQSHPPDDLYWPIPEFSEISIGKASLGEIVDQ